MNILLVIHSSGSYDDFREDPVLATFDQAKADAKVAEMKARLVRRNEVWGLINITHMKQWDAVNPRPLVGTIKPKALPNFGGGGFNKWTLTQKEQYRAAKAANMQAAIDAAKPHNEWCNRRYDELKRITATYTAQEQEDLTQMSDDSDWRVDEVPFVE